MEFSEKEFEIMIYTFAFGLCEKEDSAFLYSVNKTFLYGFDMFVGEAYYHKPDIIKDLYERAFMENYLTRPVKEWFSDWGDNYCKRIENFSLYDTGALLYKDASGCLRITEECEDLIKNATNKEQYLEDKEQYRIYKMMQGLSEELYSIVRKFIVEHPLCSLSDMAVLKRECTNIDASYDDEVEEILTYAYEEIPKGVYECPVCGWTVYFDKEQAVCVVSSCANSIHSKNDLKEVNIGKYEKRLIKAVMKYMCLPGKLEKEIADGAEELGCTAEWYPHQDLYDIKVVLPSGKLYAIDAKTHRIPKYLKKQIMQDDKFPAAESDLDDSMCERYYVVPDDRIKKYHNYCSICSVEGKPDCITISELWKRIKGDMKDGNK